MSTQPEALRLADIIDKIDAPFPVERATSAELRRLHALNEQLLDVAQTYMHHFEKHRITNQHGARDFDFAGHVAHLARTAIAAQEQTA
jgi:hypothetical protein